MKAARKLFGVMICLVSGIGWERLEVEAEVEAEGKGRSGGGGWRWELK